MEHEQKKGLRDAKAFFGDVVTETRKCDWPHRQELFESTMVVMVSLLLVSLFVGFCDKVLVLLLSALVRMGT